MTMYANGTNSDGRDATSRMEELLEKLTLEERRIIAKLSNEWEKKDQRQYPRILCSIITDCIVNGRLYRETMENISAGGAYIKTGTRIEAGMKIHQSFFIPNTEILIQSKSQTLWSDQEGSGVRFNIVGS